MALTDYVIMPSADYQDACDAIREVTGKTDLIKSGDLGTEIRSAGSSGSSYPAPVRWSMVNGQCTVTAEDYETYFASNGLYHDFLVQIDTAPLGMTDVYFFENTWWGGSAQSDGSEQTRIFFINFGFDNFDFTTGEVLDLSTDTYLAVAVDKSTDGSCVMSLLRVQMGGTDVTAAFTASEVPQVFSAFYLATEG